MTKTISPQLIEHARQGDQKAIDIVVKSAEQIIRRLTRQLTHADADDLVQNSLVRLMESLGQLTDPKAFSAWCSAIARNELRMFYRGSVRREQAQLRFGFEPTLENLPESTPDIRRAVSKLPSSQQLIIHELYVADRSYQEISEALEVPVSAVKSRLHRARKQLKQEINMQEQTQPINLTKADIHSLNEAAGFCHKGKDRQQLNGVFLDKTGFAVGTDGHHLVVRAVPALTALNDNLLLDATSLEAVKEEAALTVHLDEVKLTSKTDQIALNISRETFPDYGAILPDNQPVTCTVARSDLLNLIATARANLSSASDTTETVLVIIDLESAVLSLESNQKTSPNSQLAMSYQLPVQEPSNQLGITKAAVNINLLADCVTAVDGDRVEIRATSWNQPLDIIGEQHRTMLMPIMI